jgi:predicted GNAT family acetyltransferase
MPVTDPKDDVAVVRNDLTHRYEIHVGDVVAGFTMFRIDPEGRLHFPHTVVDPAFRGQGLATRLVADAMTYVADRGETVVPHCAVDSADLRDHEVPGLTVEWPEHPQPE